MKKRFIYQRLLFQIVKISVLQLALILVFANITMAIPAKGQEMLDSKVTLTLNYVSLENALSELEKTAHIKFSYNSRALNLGQKVSINEKNEVLSNVLNKLLKPLGIRYMQVSNRIVLRKEDEKNVGFLQETEQTTKLDKNINTDIAIKGVITDENGEKLPGVSITVKGTTRGTTTDINGEYSLAIPDNKAVLVFSFVGYMPQEIVIGNKTILNVLLQVDNKALDEVVVVGYGTAKKKDLTGAVSSVNIEDTRLQPNTNVSQILRGTTAGVLVTDNGRPGQAGSIRIRGINSISASTAPLIVLDGIIYAGGNLADINPNDIETIDILKDASSTAIYGTLATNGVIEITTKKGKSGKPKFSLNTYTGASDYAYLPNYRNPEQYLAARKDAEVAEGGAVPFSVIELANIAAGKTINPFDEIKQNAPMSNYELSVSGKTDRVNYFFSGAYTGSKSPVKGDNFTRLSSRLNLGVQATDWLKIGINSGFSSRDNSGIRASLLNTSYLSPYASLFLADGTSLNPLPQSWGLVSNPILGTLLDNNKAVTNILFSNAYADVSIWKGLSYKLNVGYTRTDSKSFFYSPSYIPLNRLGSGSKRNGENQNLTLENIVKYQQKISKNHNLDLTLLYGVYQLTSQSSFMSSQNIFNDALGYNALEVGEGFVIDASAAQNRQVSNMARLGYNIASKYFFTFSMRRDGYSAFGAGKKYGVFPAAAVSWNVSDESFFKNIKRIDFLKLRASWGRNGNRGVSEYSSLSQIGQNNYVFGNGGPTSVGLSTTTLANPNLGWETTESFNVGADIQAFSKRINASVNFYSSKTFDLLLNQTIPNTNGFENFLRNIGETKNTGFELDLKTINIQKRNFTWNTNLAFSLNRNEIVKLTGRDINKDGVEDDDIASRWFIGYTLGSNFDYFFDGIFQQGDDLSSIAGAKIGDIKFKDITGPNGTPDGKITPLDRMVVSNNQAKFNMGITNIFSYKNLSLSVALNIREGGYSSNSLSNPGSNFFDQANFLNTPYWTATNPINTNPRINYRNPFGYGFYQDRSFVRLQDVSLSYNIPEKWLSKIKVSGLQVYVSGKNLYTWTKWDGWDPEFGGGDRDPNNNGPLLKTFVGGINLSF
jgi:TonB-linked SusC/RagA family outer membrane protein